MKKPKPKQKAPASAETMDAVRRMSVWLACVYPTLLPVKVRWNRRLSKDHLGLCMQRNDYIEIQLQPGMNFELALETLSHEWAHARTAFGRNVGESPHSSRFWTELGEIQNKWNETGAFAAKRLWLPRRG